MNAEQFAYWLQGFTELTEGAQPTPEQWKSINDHLKTVFVKVTPQVGSPLNPRPDTVRPEIFADPARHMTPLDRLERGQFGSPLITCSAARAERKPAEPDPRVVIARSLNQRAFHAVHDAVQVFDPKDTQAAL